MIGMNYFMLEEQDSAFLYFNLALQKDSNDNYPYYYRGQIFFDREEYNLAIQDFKSFLKNKTDEHMLHMIGKSYLAMGEPKKAIDYFNKSMLLNDTDYYWYHSRAIAYYLNNDFSSTKNFKVALPEKGFG